MTTTAPTSKQVADAIAAAVLATGYPQADVWANHDTGAYRVYFTPDCHVQVDADGTITKHLPGPGPDLRDVLAPFQG